MFVKCVGWKISWIEFYYLFTICLFIYLSYIPDFIYLSYIPFHIFQIESQIFRWIHVRCNWQQGHGLKVSRMLLEQMPNDLIHVTRCIILLVNVRTSRKRYCYERVHMVCNNVQVSHMYQGLVKLCILLCSIKRQPTW